jgi:hypothetical protein
MASPVALSLNCVYELVKNEERESARDGDHDSFADEEGVICLTTSAGGGMQRHLRTACALSELVEMRE